ncbi:MAG: phenylalanine--tRNA ligase subunit beta [Actinomycetota bacterium]|nr:phenylalanine--tRNA ligase subunit beta [Actinomycetota bacterium]
MRVPLSWLTDFAPFSAAPADLAATLSGLGLVVEGMEAVGEGLADVVVARVLGTRAHPNADKVQVVDVDAGDGEALQIVCGAFNFGAGDLVPLAPVGARLPGGMQIGRRNVRGQWSNGMLCSGAELRLGGGVNGADADGILILDGSLDPGTPLAEALGIVSDVVFDLDVTPNRPDALSVAGVARDLAAALRLPFAIPDPPAVGGSGSGGPASTISVAVESPDLCPLFTATRLGGVAVGPSPPWLARRLTLAGMRPISNVVDVSNYVMLELGQPTHPYDLDRLPGRGFSVRRARPDETLVTLDDVERRLGPDDCLICDAEGTAIGIAGVMGGASSEISPTTSDVALEAAWFDPVAIARTSKRLGLRTEASVRFERGLDPEGVGRAVARFCQLAGEVAGATVPGPPVEAGGALPRPARVVVRTSRVNEILGTSLSPSDVSGHLQPIGFLCTPTGDGDFRVDIPSWRPDSEREIDVIEEVARHHGYTRIERTMPAVTRVGRLTPYQRDRRRVREVLVGAGVSEAWASSFLAPEDLVRAGLPPEAVEVENPMAAEESVLRPSLLPGLLRALAFNADHRRPEVALFEIGHVFLPPAPGSGAQLPVEPENLAVVLGRREAPDAIRIWDLLAEDFRLTDVGVEAAAVPGLHPTRSARIVVAGRPAGAVGEVDPRILAAHDIDGRVGWLEVDLRLVLESPRRPATYRPVSRFPSADIDLAFVVDDATPAAAVEATLRQAGRDLLESLELFDVFRGPQLAGARSLAWRLRFCALDHTLTEDELTGLRLRCIDAVTATHPARLRG